MNLTYKDAGVDTQRGQKEVQLIKNLCKSTFDKNVLSSIGGFGAMYKLGQDYKSPVLITGTDGVGTKLIISKLMDTHDTVGQDLVAMCANDIICQGARPLFFLDYIATGYLEPEKMAKIVEGIADGCKIAGASLIGGETAEMPGLYEKDEYDMAGFIVGIVEEEKIISGSKIKQGDILISLESTGIHSNGLSLARKVCFDVMNFSVDTYIEDLGKTIGQELLTPTRIYVKDVLSLTEKIEIKGISHITGGGIYENISRISGGKFDFEIDPREVKLPAIFQKLQQWGNIDTKEMYSTFNMGMGMVLVVDKSDVNLTLNHFENYKATVIGKVKKGGGEVHLAQ